MIIYIVDKIFLLFTLMLFARILGSWVTELQNTRFMHFISFYTDPYLNFFRRLIPPLGMFDLSPIIAFLALSVFQNIIKAIIQAITS